MRVLVGLTVLAAAMTISTVPAHAAPSAGPGATAYADVAATGPLQVSSTTTVGPCVGAAADEQTREARRDRVFVPLECTDATPIGTKSGTGVNFYYPTGRDTARHPLVVLSGGYGANPGYFDRLARHWASHGYVVAVSYQDRELLPYSAFRGLRRAVAADANSRSAVYRRIDLQSVVLAGHSFGATNALHAADLIGLQTRGIATPTEFRVPEQVRIRGVIAIGPAAGTVTNTVSTPTLVVSGTDDIVAAARDVRRSYDGIVDGPAWFAVLRDTTHLMTLGSAASNPQTGIETAFLDFVTAGRFCPQFAGSRWPDDSRISDAARNPRARALGCGR